MPANNEKRRKVPPEVMEELYVLGIDKGSSWPEVEVWLKENHPEIQIHKNTFYKAMCEERARRHLDHYSGKKYASGLNMDTLGHITDEALTFTLGEASKLWEEIPESRKLDPRLIVRLYELHYKYLELRCRTVGLLGEGNTYASTIDEVVKKLKIDG